MRPPGDGLPDSDPNKGVAVEDAYRDHSSLLKDIAVHKFNIAAADAEALVNEVFTAFMVRRQLIRNPRKWLIGAVCHASRAYWRAVSRTSQFPPDVAEYVDPASPSLESRIVDRVTITATLQQIDCRCREALRLFYSEGYSAAEIAEVFGTTTNNVMQILHTCRKRVREVYRELKDGKR
ncbi:MAG: RNA polymerase sigma factor [Thermoanaerobaculia bacterium]